MGARDTGAGSVTGGVSVVDLTPKFLAFYDSATAQRADPAARWAL